MRYLLVVISIHVKIFLKVIPFLLHIILHFLLLFLGKKTNMQSITLKMNVELAKTCMDKSMPSFLFVLLFFPSIIMPNHLASFLAQFVKHPPKDFTVSLVK